MVLFLLSQLCGVLALMNYTSQIFAEAGVAIDPNYAACVCAALQLFGSYLSTILIERLGRKVCSIIDVIAFIRLSCFSRNYSC